MDTEENKRIYAKIVAKAWSDDSFRAQFLSDPTKTAKDHGMQLLPDAEVVVVQSGTAFTADTRSSFSKLTVALPPRPEDLMEHDVLKASTNTFMASKGGTPDL